MTYQIRTALPSDTDFIISLVARLSEFDLPQWRSRHEIDNANLLSIKNTLQQLQPDSLILVAEEQAGVAVGFIHLQTQTDFFSGEKQGYISELAVERSCEGHGIGFLLLARAEEWACTNGHSLLSLNVFANNSRARQMYTKNGFEEEVVKYIKMVGKR